MLINVAEWRPDLLAEHAEELEVLCSQRLRAQRSALFGAGGLQRLDRRIEAHADALVLAERHARPYVERLLTSGAAAGGAAGAFVVGHGDAPALIERLQQALAGASEAVRRAMWAALELRAGRALLGQLAKTPASDAELRAGALSVIAAHDPERCRALQPEAQLFAASPLVRALSWRAAGRLAELRLDPTTYARGWADDDPAVRRAALEAAARARHAPLLGHLRQVGSAPDLARVEEHALLAALAEAGDASRLEAIVRAPALGWERYRVLALWGRAPAVEFLLEVMRAGDTVESALAGAAFYRITGVSLGGDQRVPLVPGGAEPDEFADLIHVCDRARAERAWGALRANMAGARWVYGVDADAITPEALPTSVDLESRWAAELRARFGAAAWQGRFAYDTFWGVARE